MNKLADIGQLVVSELVANLKSWWIAIMGAVCTGLSWFVGAHGFSFTGGQVQAETVLVSIVHLQLYTVPLLGLLLAYDAVLGERESGMFDVHLALGLSQGVFLVGKWLGLMASLCIALVPSMAIQAWSLQLAGGSMREFLVFSIYAGLLGGAVVSIGLLLSTLSLNRGTVVSLCVGAWLVLAVLMDFAVIGLLAFTQGAAPDWAVNALVVANPLGLYRLLSYLTFFPQQVESLLNVRGGGLVFVAAALGAWTAGPVLLAWYALARRYRPIAVYVGGGRS